MESARVKRGLIFSSFLKGGVLGAHLHTHYRVGTPHPKDQVRFTLDPPRGLKIGNSPGGALCPISFNRSKMTIDGFWKSCRESCQL